MAIIIFQHSEIGRPGRLGATLRDHGWRLDIRAMHEGGVVPTDLDNVDGVISLGGPQNVDEPRDEWPWMDAEIEFLRAAHERSLPIVGVCLGAQLLAAALGGEVAAMPQAEVGFQTISLSPAGHTETLLSGIAWDSPQLCHHMREVKTPPAGAVVLASSRRCAVQAFRAGMRSYGFQYHFEADQRLIRDLTHEAKDELHGAGYTETEIEQQIETHYADFARLADRLCVNIATCLLPTARLASARGRD